LVRLPGRILNPIEKLAKELSLKATIMGVGLFGSWSRGDAAPSSDVDLIVVDRRRIKNEYVERVEVGGLLIDLNYVPTAWITDQVPPEIDQKLYEMNVLYEQDWLLTNTKNWMSRIYRNPERVDIRTQSYVVESDMYISRATSAYNKGDLQSTQLFASKGIESVMKVIIEVNQLPISNSRFIESLRKSAIKIGVNNAFSSYLRIARLFRTDLQEVEKKLSLIKVLWKDVTSFVRKNSSVLGSLHFNIKTKLQYYTSPPFLKGLVNRTQDLINAGMYVESNHYLLQSLSDFIENYAWLASVVKGTKLDYTTLFRSIKNLENKEQIHDYATEAFNYKNVTSENSEKVVNDAKSIIQDLRKRRKEFIRKFVK
jgi:predicted nucleotidyltransferase